MSNLFMKNLQGKVTMNDSALIKIWLKSIIPRCYKKWYQNDEDCIYSEGILILPDIFLTSHIKVDEKKPSAVATNEHAISISKGVILMNNIRKPVPFNCICNPISPRKNGILV